MNMILEKRTAIFTTEDKQNITIKNYTDKEVEDNLKKYVKKSLFRRLILIIGLIISFIFSINYDNQYSFFSNIVCILLFAGCILSEILYPLNRKNAVSHSYIEIVVEQKKDIETYFQNFITTGPDSIHFYPILGKDTTTNYESIWYLNKDEYENTNVGDIVRKNI